MSNTNNDHWNFLADSLLGETSSTEDASEATEQSSTDDADTTEESSVEEVEEVVAEVEVEEQASVDETAPEVEEQTPQPLGHWGELAGTLGVEVSDPAPWPSRPSASEPAAESQTPPKPTRKKERNTNKPAPPAEADSIQPFSAEQFSPQPDMSFESLFDDRSNENEQSNASVAEAPSEESDTLEEPANEDGRDSAVFESPDFSLETPGVLDSIFGDPEPRSNEISFGWQADLDPEESEESAEDDSELDAEADNEAEEEKSDEEKRPRRRKRRRRRRRSETSSDADRNRDDEDRDRDDDLRDEDSQDSHDEEFRDDLATEDEDSTDEDEPRPRRRSRRSRRDRDRGDKERGERGRGERDRGDRERSEKRDEERSSRKAAAESRRSKDDSDIGDEDDDRKAKNRKFPTWEEAISFVISSNLEARSKAPSNSRGRGRGRRR